MTSDRFTWKPGDIEWESGEKGVKWETGGAEKSGVPRTADTPSDEAIAERGRNYWRTHVPWGSPGDFNTCVEGVMQHAGMTHDQAAGYCNLRHHEATGEWPAQHAEQMRGKLLSAEALKLVDLEVGLAVIKEETGGHVPPRFRSPRDNRSRFRKRTGVAGEHGAFAPGEKDATGLKPLEISPDSDFGDVDMDEVGDQRHRAPGEDGNTPNKAGTGIPPDVVQHQDDDHVIEDAIRDHEDGGFAPKALTPGKVTRDFPGWKYDRALAAHYAKQLAALDNTLVDAQGIADSWLGVHKAEGQTPPGGDPTPWLAQQVARWSAALRKRLVNLWREGWFLGARSARSVASTRAVDWGDWTPGNPSAARIVRTADDLNRWLQTYGVATIRSIEETRMGELADALHTSLEEGWSTDRLARQIEDVLVNPGRARMIANTETARAVSQGTLAEYRHAGVERVLWVSSEDGRVCPTCDANEALGAVPMGSVFSGTRTDAPPGHPNCRCAVVAVPEGMIVPPRDVTKFSPAKVHDKLSDHYPDKVLDWVKDAAWSDPTEVKLKHIDMARRPGGRDMKKVRSMAREIRAGKRMKPIYLVDTPSAPPLAIADGYHRALAHQHAGKQTILAHVASVDEEHGPWDRAMHDAKLNKVGPKGYEHNWVFVGVPGTGGRVFHPQHGHGTVAEHNGSSATIHFDSGHKADFAAGHDSGPPRLEPTGPIGSALREGASHDDTTAAAKIFEGQFGEFRTTATGLRTRTVRRENLRSGKETDVIMVTGKVYRGNTEVGQFERGLYRGNDGKLVASHIELKVKRNYQGQGFASEFNRHAEEAYRKEGVDRVVLQANISVGGYAWARKGFDWMDELQPKAVVTRVRKKAKDDPAAMADLKALVARMRKHEFGSAGYPTPLELSEVGRRAGRDDWAGRAGMLGSNWLGVKYL